MSASVDWLPSYFHVENINNNYINGWIETEDQLVSTLECHKRATMSNFVVGYRYVFGQEYVAVVTFNLQYITSMSSAIYVDLKEDALT